MPIYQQPPLNGWVSNLAGILPLSALIEFTEPLGALHLYELSGRGLLWSWVITPAGARLLTSAKDQASSCCLDRPGAVPKLYCMDGRWGDAYPCSNPFTIRTCVEVAGLSTKLGLANPEIQGLRRQRLRIVRVSLNEMKPTRRTFISSLLLGCVDKNDWAWTVVSIVGWLLFLWTLSDCILSGLYLATAYLAALVVTGIVIQQSHGSRPRRLLDPKPSSYSRLVVVCDSLNGNEWTAFIGPNTTIDSLLNKPLYQVEPSAHPRIHRLLLRVLVAIQWALAALACAFKDWNAIVVFLWITLCTFISSYLYSERNAIASWLRANRVQLEKVEINFTSRRAMLTTLVALNPDRESTKWIDPILAPSQDRTDWEAALQKHLLSGMFVSLPTKLWCSTDEGKK